jgi:hypothetical protein
MAAMISYAPSRVPADSDMDVVRTDYTESRTESGEVS